MSLKGSGKEGELKMREYEKMHSGKIYNCGDEELLEMQTKCLDKLYDFNDK